ncbi:hypothetical protein ACFX13_045267 [Malus domestica]
MSLIQATSYRNVLVKGGDLPDSLDAVDVFFDGEHLHELRSSHIKTRNTHGTGCTLASCIAAELAKGSSMLEAVKLSSLLRLPWIIAKTFSLEMVPEALSIT